MEMLRKKKDNSGYEIDRELTGKRAIEKNVEYQEKIEQLEEENKKLKSDLAEDDDLREELDYRKREDKELRKRIKEHVDYQTQADFRKRFEHK